MYGKLVVMLNDLKRKLPELSHAISTSVIKLDEYLTKSCRTKLYALAIGKSKILSFVLLVLFSQIELKSSTQQSSLNGSRRIGQNLNMKKQDLQSRHQCTAFFSSCFLFTSHPQMLEYGKDLHL